MTEVLNRAITLCGLPKAIQVDNGPEFAGKELDAWAYHHGVKLAFSRPGKPADNPFVESLNGRFRDEFLDVHWFETLGEVKAALEVWRVDYNTERPHTSLGMKTPAEFATNGTPLQTENIRL